MKVDAARPPRLAWAVGVIHHLALAFAPYLASFGLRWFPYLVTALPITESGAARATA